MSRFDIVVDRMLARRDTYYWRNRMFKNKGSDTAANRRTLVTPSRIVVNVGTRGLVIATEKEFDLNVDATWDDKSVAATWQATHSYSLNEYAKPLVANNYIYKCTTAGISGGSQPAWGTTPGGTTNDGAVVWTCVKDMTVAANRAGQDIRVYACIPSSGSTPVLILSAASTYPAGYDDTNSRKIAQFHCECANVGTISGHALTGYLAGDILPRSVQDIEHRPASGFMVGMVWAGKTDFDSVNLAPIWTMIYLASGTGANTTSVNGGTISDTRDWMDFVDDFAAIGCRMLEDDEFQAIAAVSNEETNIAGSADPVTTGGHSDTAGRRMISNIGCEDCCGAMWQWLRTQSYQYNPDGAQMAASQTTVITYVASLEGAPVYLKWSGPVPYLCANIVSDVWITIGSHKFQIKADAAPATGGTQIYFDDDATQPNRLLSAVVNGKDAMIASSHPYFSLVVKYNAAPATLGVELRYDNVTHSRLEAINASLANQSIDLALSSPAWAYYDLPGAKGSLYKQGTYGDVKLLAGGFWANGSYCGSRSRSAAYFRWVANSNVGGRGCAEPA